MVTEISLPQLVFSGSVILFLSYLFYNYFLHPLSKLPGPLICHLGLPSWLYSRVYHKDVIWGILEAHKKYGKNGELAPMVRIGATGISVAHADIANQVYSASLRLPKTRFYEAMTTDQRPPRPGGLFTETDNKSSAALRKETSHPYNQQSVADVATFVTPELELLISTLKKFAEEGKSFDLAEWLGYFTVDAINTMAFGRSAGCMRGGSDGGAAKMNEKFFKQGLLLGTQTWLVPIYRLRDRIFRITPALNQFLELARPIAERRLEELKRGEVLQPDLLTKFIQGRDLEAPPNLSMYRTCTKVIEVLSAGADTTANFLRPFFVLVLSDSRIYQKVMEEIEQAVEQGKLSSPATQAQGAALSYLNLCILETQRFAPVIGLPLPREIPASGMTLGDVFIPGGTSIGSSAWTVHRNKELYGEDAESFRPERWLEVDEEQRKKMERSLQFFGAGIRNCVGRHIASMEYLRLIPSLLMNFDFSIVPRGQNSPHKKVGTNYLTGERDDTSPCHLVSWWFNEWSDFYVNVTKRSVI